MKTMTTLGVRCAAIFVVMAMIITIVPTNAIIQTASASGANGPAPVDLGTAGDFVILAKSGISTTGTTKIVGDVGISPADHTYLTGFSETKDSSNQFSTSSYVTGKLYASDYTDPTPAKMTTAISDMGTAYTNASGRSIPDHTELGSGDISGMTLDPGLYKWGTDVNIKSNGVTLSGSANGVWIFQISGDLIVANTAMVNLTGGARAANIFWQVGGGAGATLGTTSVVNGNILAAKAIVIKNGAKLNGRALAQSAVTLDANNVTVPSDLPISSVDPIIPYWHNTSPLTINATASASSNYVKLYYRYAADNATWGAWTMFGNDSAAPWSWSFNFPGGNGHFQFYSRAFVNTTNNESAPTIYDQFCGYDTVLPSSSVNAIASYWRNSSPLTLTATATDATSGINNVTLYYRFAADNSTWGSWNVFGIKTAAPWSWSFNFPNGTGHYQVYTRAYDNATNHEAAPGTADQFFGYDTTAPTSSVNAMAPYWKNTSPQTVTATAADALSGVKNVTLYYRYSAANASWGSWTSFGVDSAAPWSWSFTFPSGAGYYQFYSRAHDNATNFQAAPGSADRICGYDITPPTSSVNAIAPYWKIASPLVITATAADAMSGVKNVTLYYRYSVDNTTWGAWSAFGFNLTGPLSWSFTFTNGSGYYQFYSRAHDNATNLETAPAVADQICGYDNVKPTSSVNAMAPYWKNSSPRTITATAADALTGVKNVTLYYRFAEDNATWGSWNVFGIKTAAPWSWSFTFPNGTGYYEFYSRAHDNVTNLESAPGAADQICGYDITAPTSSVDAMASYWSNTNPLAVTATATDATSGVNNVTLYYRYSTDNATWGGWTSFGANLVASWSWSFTFPNGSGYYQVYSLANDNAANFEVIPAVADQVIGYDLTPPTSGVDAIGSYWKIASPLTVTATADDAMSGVKSVSLSFRYADDNATWGAWTSFGVNLTASWSWSFTFPNGTGYYQFYTLATDIAGNTEAAPTVADQIFGYDITKPTSKVDAIAPYWKNTTSPLAVTATATDATSGVRSVILYYRYSTDNATWGGWTSFGANLVASWSWSFTFTNGTGYYEFYARATDKAGNVEAAPAVADSGFAYDNVKPVIGTDTTPITVKTGDTLTFNIAITDNINVTDAKVVYRFGTGAWVNQTLTLSTTYQYTLGIPSTSTLSVQYYVYAADAAGNWAISQTKTVTVLGTAIPTLIILGPANGLSSNVIKVAVHGTAYVALGTIATIEWSLDNSTWHTCTGTTTWSCDVSLATGSNMVIISATSSSGMKGYNEVTLTLDQSVPTLTITGLVDKSTVKKDKLTIAGTTSDNTGIAKVEVRVNSGDWQTATGTTAWTYPATLKSGTNTIDVRVTDKAGNIATQTRTIQYKKPSSSVVYPPYTIAIVEVLAALAVGAILLMWRPPNASGTTGVAAKKTDAQAKGAKKGKGKSPKS